MKVCILAAGQGRRMGRYGDYFHKALLPYKNQAILSHIIAGFAPESEFVIAVGHRSEDVIAYVRMAHPELQVTWVQVQLSSGPGSGPGQSLFECRQHLQEPFFFIACDTLIQEPLPTGARNWIGVMPVEDPQKWCTVQVDPEGLVERLHYKIPDGGRLAFTGIARVEDYQSFWQGLESDGRLEGEEKQVNSGLAALARLGLATFPLSWKDAGTLANYETLLDEGSDNYTFKGKMTDTTYRIGDRVIKYFPDEQIARQRYQRGLAHPDAFARVLAIEGRFYSYAWVTGELLSCRMNRLQCQKFLAWAEERFWRPVAVDREAFREAMVRFYRDKTGSRLDAFIRLYLPEGVEQEAMINDLPCQTVRQLVNRLTDAFYAQGFPSTFHGDLHADNILCTPEGFTLIDWRQAFGRLTDVGDRYYDLAKFLHVLELSVATMNAGNYGVIRDPCGLRLEHGVTFNQLDALEAFQEHVRDHGYDMEIIRIIDALIFINMSPLYDARMGEYLYCIGRYLLQSAANRSTRYFA